MAISDRINEMYTHVGDVYDTITNVDINNGTNLLDYSTCKIGDLNTGTGAEETSTVRIISDFIEVTPNENYICTLIGGDYTTYYYSSNKTFISGGSSWIGSGNSFTTPNNAGYLRLKFKNANNTTISLNNLSNIMLNKGNTALPYQPYTDNPTYKNIENIPSTIRKSYLDIMNNGIDTIYDNWEKVNGTGTSISLNNTEEAPMKINLKGNTSQETTTGKNLFDNSLLNKEIAYQATTSISNGVLTITSISSTGVSFARLLPTLTLSPNTQYACSFDIDGAFLRARLYDVDANDYATISTSKSGSRVSGTFTTNSNTIYELVLYITLQQSCSFSKIQVEQGSTATPYEPYTNGASPNPDYPQDIHVVSGDNYINVVGKNLFDKSTESKNYLINSAGTLTPNNDYNSSAFIPIQPLTNVVLSTDQTSAILEIVEYDTNQSLINRGVKTNSTFYNLRTSNTTAYIRISYQNTSTKVQFEKDTTTATTYEAYKGASYEINLGKNLIPFSDIISTGGTTSNGITFTLQADGTIKANGTATAGISIYLTTNYIEQKAGTYTFSDGIASGQSGTTFFLYADVRHLDETSWDAKNFSTAETATRTRTLEEAFKFKPRIVIRQGQVLNNLIFKPMLEKGSQATSYSPYFTPIELCKIGTYQDRIFKSSGKNLFDNTYNDLGMWITNIGETTTFAQGSQYLGAYCKVEPGTYTISRNKKTNRFRIGVSPNQPTGTTSSCYVVASNDNASSITIDVPQGNNYICVYLSNNSETSTNVDLMIEKGSSASDYQPYGVGKWYLHKEIGKVDLGTLNYTRNYAQPDTYRCTTTGVPNIKYVSVNTELGNGLAEKYLNHTGTGMSGVDAKNHFAIDVTMFQVTILKEDTPSGLFYYALATPTYTEITDTTLLSQLEAVKKSYTTQTNISQENNGLPFILDVTALKQLTQ